MTQQTKPAYETKKYIIAIDIELVSPMHITAIEKGSYDPKTQRLHRYDGTGIGCNLTHTKRLLNAIRVKDGVSYIPLVPVIPTATIAGKLRRYAADFLFQSFVKRGLVITPDAYNTATSGMANTELKADSATHESNRAARRDPFLSLFGGTSFAMGAGSVIGEGWPLLEVAKNLPMSEPIAPVLGIDDLRDMTDALAIVRKNDVASQTGKHLINVVSEVKLIEYLQSETDARAASKAKKAADEDSKKTDLRTLNAFECVRTGMGFAIRIEVTSRTPAHLGLMLLATQKFMQEGQVGGKSARGFGRFVVSASRLYELDPSNRQTTVVSSIFSDKNSGYKLPDNTTISQAVDAANDYIDSVDSRLLEAFANADAKAIKALTEAAQ